MTTRGVKLAFVIILIFQYNTIFSQRNCGFIPYQEDNLKKFPRLEGRFNKFSYYENYSAKVAALNEIITIPVVVHVVYKKEEENIPDFEIQNQIRILNEDYGGTNTDASQIPGNFKSSFAGDCKIRFRLEAITRTRTNTDIFYLSTDYIKSSLNGGVDAGDYTSNKFLNIWVGNIAENKQDDLLGYAPFPGYAPASRDGVVIHYKVLGTPGYLPDFNKGRTATHEIGHWLGLHHLWGDTWGNDPDCAEDGISDTPLQQYSNIGCPDFPKLPSCENNSIGDMFMNYLDYVNDPCMLMFSAKQRDRMRANFIEGGARVDIVLANPYNLALFKNDPTRNDEFAPVIAKFTNDSLTWKPVNGATKYTISLKALDDEQPVTFTTEKLSTSIQGLDESKLYEIQIVVAGSNPNAAIKTASSPLLVQPKQIKEKIIFKEF